MTAMRRLLSVVLCLLAVAAFDGLVGVTRTLDAAPEKAKPEVPPIKLHFENPAEGQQYVSGAQVGVHIRVERLSGPAESVPKKYLFTFTRKKDRAIGGQYIGEVKRDGDTFTCSVMTKFPPSVGEYTLEVEPVAVLPLAKTPAEKVSAGMKVEVVP